LKNYRLAWQVLGSHTRELEAPDVVDTTQKDGCAQQFFDRDRHTVALDGESFSGHAVWVGFERSAHRWSIDLDYEEHSPAFRADNGFVTRNGHRSLLWHSRYYFEPNGEWLLKWGPTLGIGRIWEHSGFIDLDPTSFSGGPKDEWVQPGLYFRVKGLTDIGISYLNSREWFGGLLFEGISRVYVNVDSRFSELLSGGMHLVYGRSIYRARAREYDEVIPVDEREFPEDSIRMVSIRPELGKQTDLSIYASLKPTQRLAIEPDFNFARMEHRERYLARHPDEDKKIYSGYIFRTRLTYQFTREWYLRLVVQYDDFRERMDIEPLLTYRLNPFTVFYAGFNSRYQYFDESDYSEVDDSAWELSSRQFFAKLQYLFRI